MVIKIKYSIFEAGSFDLQFLVKKGKCRNFVYDCLPKGTIGKVAVW